jgi:hypothetical protein
MGSASSASSPQRCEERDLLRRNYDAAAEAFAAVEALIRERVGRIDRDEFVNVDRRSEDAGNTLQSVRLALETHVREHGCGMDPELKTYDKKPIW